MPSHTKTKTKVPNKKDLRSQKLVVIPEQRAETAVWAQQYRYSRKRYLNIYAKMFFMLTPIAAFNGFLFLGNQKNLRAGTDLLAEIEGCSYVFLGMLFLAFLHKTRLSPYVIERLARRILKKPLQLLRDGEWQQRDKIDEINHNLLEANKRLATSTLFNVMSMLFFNLYVFNCIYLIHKRIPPEFISYVFFGDVIDLITAIKELRLDYQTKGILEKKLALLNNALSPYVDIKIAGASLKNTRSSSAYFYFIIESKNYSHLDNISINKIIKKILLASGLRIAANNQEKTIIAGDVGLDEKKMRIMQKQVLAHFERTHSIQLLLRQLLKLNAVVNPETRFQMRVENTAIGQEWIEVILPIPTFYVAFFSREKIMQLFKPSGLELVPTASEGLEITMTAYQVDKLLLRNFLDELSEFYFQKCKSKAGNCEQGIDTFQDPCVAESKHEKGLQYRKREQVNQAEHGSPLQTKIQQSVKVRILIKWKSACYDSTDKNCQVFPLDIPNPKMGHNSFGFFALTEDDFSGNRKECKKFKTKAMRGKRATKKGEEGYRDLDESEKFVAEDKEGNPYVPDFKLKVLGVFGRRRGFGRREYSIQSNIGKADDEALMVIDYTKFTH